VGNLIKKEAKEVRGILGRIKRRDLKGNSGQAIKNSSYAFATTLLTKIGSFAFTIILARILMPELFGLYSLALATIIMFTVFSNLGFGSAMIIFVSKSLKKGDPGKAKAYFEGLLKYRIYLILFTSFLLLALANFIAKIYYNKPIFFALLAGAIYLPIMSLQGYLGAVFQAENKFKYPMIQEIIFQLLRLTIIPLTILFLLNLPKSIIILVLILLTALCHLAGLLYLRITSSKKITFLKSSKKILTSDEKKRVKKFIIPVSLTVLSGMFFGYIDTLMLGHYVESAFIGYYGVALGLVGSIAALIGFIPGSLLPIFSRLRGESLERAFKKTRTLIILISIPTIILTVFIAKYIIMIYGAMYAPAILLLQLFSVLILTLPLSGLYNVYLTSMEKTATIAKLSIFSTLLNILLNWRFITYGLRIGMMQAVMGAVIATIISRVVYLMGIHILKKKSINK